MTNILARVDNYFGRFTPSKPTEYLALQIARRLNDAQAFRHYQVLFEHYPENLLLDVYRRCNREGNLSGEHFMNILREITN